jgi:hypothetical protein
VHAGGSVAQTICVFANTASAAAAGAACGNVRRRFLPDVVVRMYVARSKGARQGELMWICEKWRGRVVKGDACVIATTCLSCQLGDLSDEIGLVFTNQPSLFIKNNFPLMPDMPCSGHMSLARKTIRPKASVRVVCSRRLQRRADTQLPSTQTVLACPLDNTYQTTNLHQEMVRWTA